MRSVRARVVAAAFLACAVAAAPAASVPGPAARLTFVRDGSIFLAAGGGRNEAVYLREETDSSGWRTSYTHHSWSPDGTRAAVDTSHSAPASSEMNDWFGLVVYRRGRPEIDPVCRCSDASWSPGGRRLVAVAIGGWSEDYDYTLGGLDVIDPQTRTRRRLTPITSADGEPAWSPDGRLVAFLRQGRLHVIPPTGGKARRLTARNGLSPSWSPDGRSIAFDDGRRIGIVGRNGGRVRFIATGTDPAWSPDGTTIAFVRNGNVWLVGADGRAPRLAVRNARQPAWRPLR